MRVTWLHNLRGDDPKDFDTSDPEQRKQVAEQFATMLKAGSAIFLKRADGETLRVTGYDPNTDQIFVADESPSDQQEDRDAETIQEADPEADNTPLTAMTHEELMADINAQIAENEIDFLAGEDVDLVRPELVSQQDFEKTVAQLMANAKVTSYRLSETKPETEEDCAEFMLCDLVFDKEYTPGDEDS